MPDSRELAAAAVAEREAGEALGPQAQEAQARLAVAERELEFAEREHDKALALEAAGKAADVDTAETVLSVARRAYRGLSNLTGQLTLTKREHLDRAEALRQAALEARRAERAALAMRRLPELAQGIVAAVAEQGELGHEFELERGILMSPGPWNRAAGPVMSAAMRTLKAPMRVKPPGNRGENIARELELNIPPTTTERS